MTKHGTERQCARSLAAGHLISSCDACESMYQTFNSYPSALRSHKGFESLLTAMTSTIVLISGANRGIGKGLLELYLAKPNHTVIAANRDPENAASKALASLPTGSGSRLIVVKVDASIDTDALAAVNTLTSQGIDHIDIVIANAGVSYIWPKVSDLKIEDLQGHLVPNVFGVVWLYQATLPLLLEAEQPKFATIGSIAGCLEVSLPFLGVILGVVHGD